MFHSELNEYHIVSESKYPVREKDVFLIFNYPKNFEENTNPGRA